MAFLFNNYSGCVNQTCAYNSTIKSCPSILRVDDTCILNQLNAFLFNQQFFYKMFIIYYMYLSQIHKYTLALSLVMTYCVKI